MRVLVAGAGVWGAWIAEHLAGQGQEVVVVEQDQVGAARARASGKAALVIRGDACEPSVLERTNPESLATVVAATGDDEDNLVISLLAKRMFGVPRVVARVNNPKNTWLFDETWGVDTAVSAPAVLTHLLDAAIGVQEVVAMLRTGRTGVAVVELTIEQDSPAAGRRPADLALPEGAVVVAVVRGDEVLVAGGSGPLAAGDELLAVTTMDAEPALRLAIGGHPGGSHGPVT